ncbi:MAG: hemolysin XhlA family protein [Firmicutes bacterium]|nr:hemolysin XhlA family protein [Bacillota bacterium]
MADVAANGYSARLDALDDRVERVERRLDSHGDRISALERATAAGDVRTGGIADDVAEIKSTLRWMSRTLAGLALGMVAEILLYLATQGRLH